MAKRILIGIVIILILAQFIRPPHNNGIAATPNDITHVVQVPDTVLSILKVSCYDCHSNYTRYPWYSKITPVNWWLYNHIIQGKMHINYSEYTGSYKRMAKRLKETSDEVKNHKMPLPSYLWIHTDAKLSEGQQKLVIDWANQAQQQVLQDSLKSVHK